MNYMPLITKKLVCRSELHIEMIEYTQTPMIIIRSFIFHGSVKYSSAYSLI